MYVAAIPLGARVSRSNLVSAARGLAFRRDTARGPEAVLTCFYLPLRRPGARRNQRRKVVAGSDGTLDPDATTHALQDLAGDGEPSPVPEGRVVKKGSKIRSSSSGGMPLPGILEGDFHPVVGRLHRTGLIRGLAHA